MCEYVLYLCVDYGEKIRVDSKDTWCFVGLNKVLKTTKKNI